MDYYIEGNAAKAEQIKSKFEKLGYNVKNWRFTTGVYYTLNGRIVNANIGSNEYELILNSSDYKELELPVEPKFRVGDWLVYNDGGSFCGGLKAVQVQTVEKNMYIFTHDTNGSHSFIDSECHLWTIKDAKDGDVLITENGNPFIFLEDKVQAGYHNIIAYCGITTMGSFCDSSRKECWTYGASLKPATKEQRNLLFTKMKEAGYEWDADKKELRKIKFHYDISNFHAGMPVLVRDDKNDEWRYVQFSHVRTSSSFKFVAGAIDWQQCIPFEGNEHLLGTTDMCDEQYINW